MGRNRGVVMALMVLAVGGCEDDPVDPDNQDPVAAVTASPMSVPASDGFQTIVTIDASGSADPDGDPLTFSWVVPSGRFENGTSDGEEVIQVSFPGAAPYQVVVTVRDGNGGEDQASVTVGIS